MVTIKSKDDIAILQEGGKRHARILKELAKLVHPGVSSFFLEQETRRLIKEGGDSAAFLGYQPDSAMRPFPAALCFSVNDEIVHGIPNEGAKILKEGDIVTLDLGLNHKGYITDSAMTVPVGKVSSETARLLEATEKALEAGIRAVRPGARVGDIGAAISSVAKEYGYALAEGLAGHGVGYAVHEDPYVPNDGKAGEGIELKPGMVFAIEPMLTLGKGKVSLDFDGYTFRTKDGSRSAHFEHTVAVTEDGVSVLTSFS